MYNNFALNGHCSYTKVPEVCCVAGVGFLDSVKLESAREGGQGDVVTHIERCTCVDGYIGQFCDECAPGYHRDPPHGGPLARCVPCNCNGHSEVCEVDTGEF